MTAKSFLFVAAWMRPLKALSPEQRWNVMEAIAEYSISGEVTMSLDVMETIAFGFIRNEIDRMREFRAERRETRRTAAKSLWTKEKGTANKAEDTASSDANDGGDTNNSSDANDANVCNAEQGDAPYYILSESKSESESESESEKTSSSTSRARVRGGAEKVTGCRPRTCAGAHYPHSVPLESTPKSARGG